MNRTTQRLREEAQRRSRQALQDKRKAQWACECLNGDHGSELQQAAERGIEL